MGINSEVSHQLDHAPTYLTCEESTKDNFRIADNSLCKCAGTSVRRHDLAAQRCQLPIFLMAPRGVCSVPSLLMSKAKEEGVNDPGL